MPVPVTLSTSRPFGANEAPLATFDIPTSADCISPERRDPTIDSRRARPRVLVVDDEIRQDDALVQLLAFEGFDAVCTTTGADALARARSEAFDSIVLDLHLPDMLGLSVLSELRRSGVAVPVVAMTGWFLDDGHEEASRALGAAAYLRKPLDHSVLAATLRAVIAEHAILPPPLGAAPMQCRRPVSHWHSTDPRAADEDRLRLYHERAVSGDDTAADRIVADLFPSLRRRLRRAFTRTPDDWIHDAVVDALLEYRARPSRYDASRGITLSGYLLFAARRNLLNRVDLEARRGRHLITALSDCLSNPSVHFPEVVPPAGEFQVTIAVPENDFTDPERTVLRLWRAGERRTAVYAKALGLGSSPSSEQRLRVMRLKDRVVQRLRRWASRGSGTARNG